MVTSALSVDPSSRIRTDLSALDKLRHSPDQTRENAILAVEQRIRAIVGILSSAPSATAAAELLHEAVAYVTGTGEFDAEDFADFSEEEIRSLVFLEKAARIVKRYDLAGQSSVGFFFSALREFIDAAIDQSAGDQALTARQKAALDARGMLRDSGSATGSKR